MKKRLFALLLALVMALGLTVTAWAEMPIETISYLDENGATQTKISTDCVMIGGINVPSSPWGKAGEIKWYVISGNVTIDGKLDMTGDVHLILKDGCSLTVNGTLGVDKLTVYGQSGGTGRLTVTGTMSQDYGAGNEIRGISANYLTVNGGIVTASTVDAGTSGAGVASFGIKVENHLVINGGSVTATGGNGYTSSWGIFLNDDLTINGGSVTGTGGNCTSTGAVSYGVHSQYGKLALGGSGRLTATGGTATTSYGIYLVGYGKGTNPDPGCATMTSGTLIAKTTATGSNAGAMWVRGTFAPPTVFYWWRTEENGAFTKSEDAAYVYDNNSDATYTEITTVDPTPPAVPDASAHGHTRRQPTTTTTEVVPDTAATDTVTSAKTFDAGVAVYGVMAVSALLGMGYVGKKRV